jgi:hypothetical protein
MHRSLVFFLCLGVALPAQLAFAQSGSDKVVDSFDDEPMPPPVPEEPPPLPSKKKKTKGDDAKKKGDTKKDKKEADDASLDEAGTAADEPPPMPPANQEDMPEEEVPPQKKVEKPGTDEPVKVDDGGGMGPLVGGLSAGGIACVAGALPMSVATACCCGGCCPMCGGIPCGAAIGAGGAAAGGAIGSSMDPAGFDGNDLILPASIGAGIGAGVGLISGLVSLGIALAIGNNVDPTNPVSTGGNATLATVAHTANVVLGMSVVAIAVGVVTGIMLGMADDEAEVTAEKPEKVLAPEVGPPMKPVAHRKMPY